MIISTLYDLKNFCPSLGFVMRFQTRRAAPGWQNKLHIADAIWGTFWDSTKAQIQRRHLGAQSEELIDQI